ncbi:GIN domain-containing protein [Thermoproteota archaeon]
MPFCSKCGTELVEGTKYCTKCGMAIGSYLVNHERGPIRRAKRKPISRIAIILTIIVVVVVLAGLLSTVFIFGGGHLFGEIIGSGDLITHEEIISDFTSVDAGSGFIVEISKSNSYEVLVTTDDNVMEHIEIKKSGDTLVIGTKWGYSFRSVTLKVEITTPELHSLELSGGAQGKIEEFSSDNTFSVKLSGGSVLRGEFETSKDVDLDLSGGSVLSVIVGEANDLTIDASSGSVLDLSDFTVHNVNVELSGASRATINLDGGLSADLSGGSNLSYIGDPTIRNIETSGGSKISKQSLPD